LFELAQAAGLGEADNVYLQDTNCVLPAYRDQMKQAFFELLRHHFKAFVKDGVCVVQFPNQPAEFKELTADYLATSDDMWGWFTSKYEQTEASAGNIVSIKVLYDTFSRSSYFELMNKADKRNNNLKRFKERCNANIFLAQIIKRVDQRVGGVKLTIDSVVGWVEKGGVVDSAGGGSMRNV